MDGVGGVSVVGSFLICCASSSWVGEDGVKISVVKLLESTTVLFAVSVISALSSNSLLYSFPKCEVILQ